MLYSVRLYHAEDSVVCIKYNCCKQRNRMLTLYPHIVTAVVILFVCEDVSPVLPVHMLVLIIRALAASGTG